MRQYIFRTSTVRDGTMSLQFGDENEVHASRRGFLTRIGVTTQHTALMHVNHGDTIRAVTRREVSEPFSTIEAEALMTDDSVVALSLLTADCLPVAYIDEARGALALAHIGWRPALLDLPPKVVDHMEHEYGTQSEHLRVHIGPGIAKESYVFPRISQRGSSWAPHITRDTDGNYHVDLKGFVRARLITRGVPPDRIVSDPSDTGVDTTYFSHYRAMKEGTHEGRMISVLGWVV